MTKKELLKKLVNDFGIHSLCQKLNIDYKELVDRQTYEHKVHDKGLDILLAHKDLKSVMLDWIFPFENNGLMLNQDYFLTNPTKAYDQLLELSEEKEINKIFEKSSLLLSKKEQSYQKYINKYIKFLALVINKNQDKKEDEKMFDSFTKIEKIDKADLFPILKEFLDKKISADKVYDSIKHLDNSYLETTLVDYLYQKDIAFSFSLKTLDMYQSEEKIVYVHNIKFNTNYFMKMGVNEKQVIESLEVFSDLICNIPEVNYLIKKKDKTFELILRSENEQIIKILSSQIKQHSALISEFVTAYKDNEEYKSKFMIYWHLNKQFNHKEKSSKLKI